LEDLGLAAVGASGVRAVAGSVAVQAEMPDPGPGKADIVGVDLGRVGTVIVGETSALSDARPAAGRVSVYQEVIGLGEHRERRRPPRIGIDHMKYGLFRRVGKEVVDRLVGAGVG